MPLSAEAVKKFQQIHREMYGTEISYEDAAIYGRQLVELVRLVYKPIPRKDYEAFKVHEETKVNQPTGK